MRTWNKSGGISKLFLFERGKLKKTQQKQSLQELHFYPENWDESYYKLLAAPFCLFLRGEWATFFCVAILVKERIFTVQTWFTMAQKWPCPAHLLRGFIKGHGGIDEFEPVLHLQHQLLPVQGHLLSTFSDGISIIMTSLQQHFSLLLDLQGTLVCLL